MSREVEHPESDMEGHSSSEPGPSCERNKVQ